MEIANELDRIKTVYEKRKVNISPELYSFFNQGNLFIIQNREREIIKVLKMFGYKDLSDKKILDVGCGVGGELRNFIRYGAKARSLYGVDLLSDRIEYAKEISPNIDFICADASKLPYHGEDFDIIIQFTVFSSILDKAVKHAIAAEMIRVLKPQDIILYYDFHMNNPKNPDVKGIKKREIKELFPDCKFWFNRITLAPPIARLIAPYSWLLCYLLEKLKFLNTHYLVTIKRS